MDIDAVTIQSLRKNKIYHQGFNISLIVHPDHKNHYVDTIRKKVKLVGYD